MAFHGSAFFLLFLLIAFPLLSHAAISSEVAEQIKLINSKGEYYALLVAGQAELKAVLAQGWFLPDQDTPSLNISARRFYVGEVEGHRTILAMSGSGSKFGGSEGSYTRKIANLTFADYNVGEESVNNRLQTVYFQRETLYTKPENGKTKFWFNVDDKLYAIAKKIQDTQLDKCVAKSNICLQEQPEIRRVERGGSANFYVSNEAFRDFLHNKLNIASIDVESAAIALVCGSKKIAFIAMRSVTNYAGGSSAGNDASVIKQLWSSHARSAIVAFFNEVASEEYSNLRSVTGGEIW